MDKNYGKILENAAIHNFNGYLEVFTVVDAMNKE